MDTGEMLFLLSRVHLKVKIAQGRALRTTDDKEFQHQIQCRDQWVTRYIALRKKLEGK